MIDGTSARASAPWPNEISALPKVLPTGRACRNAELETATADVL